MGDPSPAGLGDVGVLNGLSGRGVIRFLPVVVTGKFSVPTNPVGGGLPQAAPVVSTQPAEVEVVGVGVGVGLGVGLATPGGGAGQEGGLVGDEEQTPGQQMNLEPSEP